MDNSNFWDWDKEDEHKVSFVYRDTEAEIEDAKEQSGQSQDIDSEKKDTNASEPVTENNFILVDNPQNRTQNDASFAQTEYQQNNFRQIVPLQNIQQNQGTKDQNADFSQKDISENKVSAMAAYLLGPVGIIIALLIARDSAYAAFHVRQALKLTVCSVALELIAAIFALFAMIPLVGIIFKLVLLVICAIWLGVLVLRLIAIAQVCDGEAREPAVIGKMNCFH